MLNKRCYYVRGNHDIIYNEEPPLGCVNIDGNVINHEGIRILGLEGSMWYGGRGVEYTDWQMRWKVWKAKFQIWRRRGVDIVLTHAPPKGIHDGKDLCHTGFYSFLKLIGKYRPRYFIHGHTHESYGYSREKITQVQGTKVVNVEGKHILEIQPRMRKKITKREGWWGTVFRLRQDSLKSFYAESRARRYLDSIDRGIQTVKVDDIVGSVGRPLDFGRNFSIKGVDGKPHIRSRVKSIEKAMEKGKPLPAVELYKMDDEYYVLDGHHRVAAAKEQGQKFIDAHIVEYLPTDDGSKRLLIQKRIEFEDETGLGGINLLHRRDYDKLLLQIGNHKKHIEEKIQQKISLEEAARNWFRSLYRPVTEKIKKLKLRQYFPKTTIGDMYVYLCDQARLRSQSAGDQSCPLPEALEEIGILKKATKIILSGGGFKEKARKVLGSLSRR
jgi:uncharacterized ParB-like nuclease family protein